MAVRSASPRALLAAFLGGVLAMGVVSPPGEAPTAGAYTITSKDRLVTIGGTIRKRDGRWQVWDPNHAHRGLGRVTCLDGGGLRIELRPVGIADGFGAVSVDGVLAARGVAVGASANTRQLSLTLARNGERISCGSEVFGDPGTNIWITRTQVVRVGPGEPLMGGSLGRSRRRCACRASRPCAGARPPCRVARVSQATAAKHAEGTDVEGTLGPTSFLPTLAEF